MVFSTNIISQNRLQQNKKKSGILENIFWNEVEMQAKGRMSCKLNDKAFVFNNIMYKLYALYNKNYLLGFEIFYLILKCFWIIFGDWKYRIRIISDCIHSIEIAIIWKMET